MWSARIQQLDDGRVVKVERENGPMSFSEVLRGWRKDADFRRFFAGLLNDAPYRAFRWETPPITAADLDRQFEFAILDSPELPDLPDPHSFEEHFANADPDEGVVSFENLGRDAILIVPCPRATMPAYAHLAAFVRTAPVDQQHALWKVVGEAMELRLGAKPVWLSTAGAGVAWLHIRLDDRPKYYRHGPYRRDSASRGVTSMGH
jgi:hypothetical protein